MVLEIGYSKEEEEGEIAGFEEVGVSLTLVSVDGIVSDSAGKRNKRR
ncbi:MAG: hypothetical protein AVDCRST_MAG14-1591 [uncultured Rubrobacteraceae bacterium]|uniref:Uncharacterized protein n=1 Tax=uncultured Rubrobacteraceae bacterium TaxID=349277 RepID=A0A6J4QUZ9_9ACTN|nr:MAG: hypothetical protein AVDCRST_MAG14-1591 [uncultured Rubrobacteraceae bacterium]